MFHLQHHAALIQKLLSAPLGQHRPNPLDFDSFSYPHPLTVSVEILHTFAEIQPQIFRQILFMEAPQALDAHYKRNELLKLPPESAQSQQLLMLLCRVLGKADNESVQVVIKDIFLKVVCGVNMELPERDEMNALFYDRGIMDALLELLFTDLSETPQGSSRNHYLGVACYASCCECLAHRRSTAAGRSFLPSIVYRKGPHDATRQADGS